MASIKELIKTRKSVRTFNGEPLTQEARDKMEAFFAGAKTPFGVPVTFRMLDAKEHGLSSVVIIGANTYFAAKAPREPHFELSLGYAFEAACLYAWSLGLGSVMLAASLSRAAFEKAMEVGENEVMPVGSPIGWPAEKRSLRETVMRKGIKADTRLPFETLFFDGEFGVALTPEKAGVFADALEGMRLAPSAANKQPWRAVKQGDHVHFYEARSMKDNALGDVQKVDLGIGLSHFELVLQENGKAGAFTFDDPGLAVPENTEYIVTYELHDRA